MPLEDNINTLCLFLLTPFAGTSSFGPLVFDNDL